MAELVQMAEQHVSIAECRRNARDPSAFVPRMPVMMGKSRRLGQTAALVLADTGKMTRKVQGQLQRRSVDGHGFSYLHASTD